jgi:hypothetical protein
MMTKAIERAAAKAKRNKCRAIYVGGRAVLVVTPQNHKYTVRFHVHDGQRYGVCNCKAGAANVACYHLIPAALLDTAVQNMRTRCD